MPTEVTSIRMEDIISPNTTGTLRITFNESIGEANLNAYVSVNPAYIGALGEITSADGGITYTGTITATEGMNRLRNEVNMNYNGLTGQDKFDVLSDSTLLENISQKGEDIAGESGGCSMSDNGETIAIGIRDHIHSGLSEWVGMARIYKMINGTWTQLGDTFLGTQQGQSLGHFTILSGDGTRVAISSDAYFNGEIKGSVSVYDWNGTTWVQVGSKLELPNTVRTSSRFGWQTDMSKDGNTIIVGSVNYNYTNVYNYDIGTSDWVLKGSSILATRFSGSSSISRDGLTVMIEGETGAEIYNYDVGTSDWVRKGQSLISEGTHQLSGDGDMLIILSEDSTPSIYGTVQVYEWNGTVWVQKGNDINGDELRYGYATGNKNLKIQNENGINLFISEYNKNTNGISECGRVNIYEWDGTNWLKKINIDGTNQNEHLGYGLDISRYGEQLILSTKLQLTRVYNISPTIERRIISMSMNDTTIKFPDTGTTFEIKYSTNDKTIGEVQGGLSLEPIEAGTLTNVTMGNNGFSLVGTYNAPTQSESTGNKLKYSEGGLSAEVEFILSTAEKAISNICFRGEAKVLTREGEMEIKKVKRGMIIQGEKIEEVTRTISKEKEVVLMKKGSIMKNMPKEDTVITKEHKVLYKGKMVEAKELVNGRTVVYEEYKGETLYNILLSGEGKMVVNGMIVETLSPSNNISKLYKMLKGYKEEEKKEIIKIYNEEKIKKNKSQMKVK
jgi:hypothetical protein